MRLRVRANPAPGPHPNPNRDTNQIMRQHLLSPHPHTTPAQVGGTPPALHRLSTPLPPPYHPQVMRQHFKMQRERGIRISATESLPVVMATWHAQPNPNSNPRPDPNPNPPNPNPNPNPRPNHGDTGAQPTARVQRESCNPTHPGLQPCAPRPATPRAQACNPTCAQARL